MTRRELLEGVLTIVKAMGCIANYDIQDSSVEIVKNENESVTYNVNDSSSSTIDHEPEIIKDVKMSPVFLEPETFLPFCEVSFKLYPEARQDLRGVFDPESEHQMIGKQLSDGIREARSHLNTPDS